MNVKEILKFTYILCVLKNLLNILEPSGTLNANVKVYESDFAGS